MDIKVEVVEHTITTSSCDVCVGNVDLTFSNTKRGVRKVASARWTRPATNVVDELFYEALRQATNAITSKYNEVYNFPRRTSQFVPNKDRVMLALKWGREQKLSRFLESYEQIMEWLVHMGRWTLEREKEMLSIYSKMGRPKAARTRAARKKHELATAKAARQGSLNLGGNDQ